MSDEPGLCRDTRPPLDLDAIRERCEKATPGPWHVYLNRDADGTDSHGVGYRPEDPMDCPSLTCGHLTEADASFIAHAREDVPALIAEVETLRDENARLRADLRLARERAEIDKWGSPA